MPNDPNDIRTVWQSQTKEPTHVSLELIRYKAQQLESLIRRQVVGVYVVVLGIVAACLFIFWRVDQVFIRMGAAVLVLWAVSLAYQARKGVWPGRLSPDATLKASLESYRQELERQRFYVRAAGRTSPQHGPVCDAGPQAEAGIVGQNVTVPRFDGGLGGRTFYLSEAQAARRSKRS